MSPVLNFIVHARHRRPIARSMLLAFALGATPAIAQHRPYETLHALYDRGAEADTELHALIESLRAAVARPDLGAIDAALAASVMPIECDGDPAKPCPQPSVAPAAAPIADDNKRGAAKAAKANKGAVAKPDPRSAQLLKLPPAQRMRSGLCCRDVPIQHVTAAMRDEALLGAVGAALEEETVGANPDLPGAACMPAMPIFDRAKAARLALAADVDNANLRVAAAELVLRDRPARGAAEVARIAAGEVAPLVTEAAAALPDGWNAIALPQGGIGYSDQGGLSDLTPAGLCFVKQAGSWKIGAVVQRRP